LVNLAGSKLLPSIKEKSSPSVWGGIIKDPREPRREDFAWTDHKGGIDCKVAVVGEPCLRVLERKRIVFMAEPADRSIGPEDWIAEIHPSLIPTAWHLPVLSVSLERPSQRDVLKPSPQGIVSGDVLQVAGESENTEHAYEQSDAHAEISSLEAADGAPVNICSRGDLGLRHVAA
jgi:hypothetical protein